MNVKFFPANNGLPGDSLITNCGGLLEFEVLGELEILNPPGVACH